MTPSETEEIKRHFDVVAEGLRSEIKLVAEALDGKIDAVDAGVGRLEEEMRRGFAETQAMIKFSYAELDRRVSQLETGFANVETRLRKLEAR